MEIWFDWTKIVPSLYVVVAGAGVADLLYVMPGPVCRLSSDSMAESDFEHLSSYSQKRPSLWSHLFIHIIIILVLSMRIR